MGFLKFATLALLSLHALTGVTADVAGTGADLDVDEVAEELENPSTTPNLNVKVSASFPQSEIFGIKLVNGRPSEAHISVANNEPRPVTVSFIGGSLWTESRPRQPPQIVRNLTTTNYGVTIPAGEKESLTYSFVTDFHPQDLRLNLATVLTDAEGRYFTMQVFNETVTVVEAPTSIFDPQIIFLYLILAAAFAGTSYFIYNTWIATLFPQKRRGGKGGERAKTSSRQSKAINPAEQVSVGGADGPAVTTGAKAYDESWIPEHHIKRPEAKTIRSGTPSGVRTKKA